jgi:hypothetical protein
MNLIFALIIAVTFGVVAGNPHLCPAVGSVAAAGGGMVINKIANNTGKAAPVAAAVNKVPTQAVNTNAPTNVFVPRANNVLEQTRSSIGKSNMMPDKSKAPQKQVPTSGTGKERSTDKPSWVRDTPNVGENGNAFAERLLDEKYGKGNWKKGQKSEYDKIKKYGNRGFTDPPPTVQK